MLTKVLIIAMLGFIVFNLAMGMVYLIRDQGRGTRTLNALKWRVGLSVLLFGLLILGVKLGLIETHDNPLRIQTSPVETDG